MELYVFGILFGFVIQQNGVYSEAISHETNLIWSQTPMSRAYSNSRLMAITGNPLLWLASKKPQVKHIAAPHFTWEFRALGYHWEDQLLFWSESTNKKIQSVYLNGSLDTATLFTGTSSEVYGLTVDWLSRNLYFTDALYNWIMLKPIVPTKPGYRIVVQDKLDAPHGVAVHPLRGYLFWSDWGVRPKIERSGLLGENRRILLDRGVVKPQGLALDYLNNHLYWVDSFKCTLEVADFHGEGRKVLHIEEGTSFFGISLFQSFIFVTEKTRSMLKVYTSRTSVISYKLGAIPWDIIMYDNSSQPGNSSDCLNKNCEHLCIFDVVKGATCLCGEGYVPEDEEAKSCKVSQQFVHPSHFYAIGDSICRYPANMADMPLENLTLRTQCFLGEKNSHPGYMTLTFDAAENMLYYFSNSSKTISRLPLRVGAKATVVDGGTGAVNGLSLDWVSGNLYWTDTTHHNIMVAKKNGKYQRVLIERLSTPVGIAVHPGRCKIYWTDQGHMPHIPASVESANLDGSERVTIMRGDVTVPNHIFIDFKNESVYWADSFLNHVRKLDIITGRITVVYEQKDVKFYGISIFNDFLIWTDTEDLNGVHMARMDTKEKIRGIIHPGVGVASDLITFDPRNQPNLTNPCDANTTKCEQMCLASSSTAYKCYCGLGYTLSEDGFSCFTSPVQENFLLVNDAFQKKIFQVDLLTAQVQAVDLDTTNMAIAIAHDPLKNKVFWSDNVAKEIREATIDGRYEKTVVYFNSSSVCDGMAADYINRLLFFTDTGNNLIGVASLHKENLYTYIITEGLHQPRDIIVSPHEGQIYWSDWGDSPGIEKANMDGTERTTIFKPAEGTQAWINGLALDYQESMLYWVDAQADTISSINLNSGDVKVLLTRPSTHYFSLDVIGEYIYLTDWMTNYIQRVPKRGGRLRAFGPRNFTRLYGIRGFNRSEIFTGLSVCASSACEHLCLPKMGKHFTCKCAEGYELSENGLNCNKIITTTLEMSTTVGLETTTSSKPITSSAPATSYTSSAVSKQSSSPSSSSSSSSLSSESPLPSSSMMSTYPEEISSNMWQSTTPLVVTIPENTLTRTMETKPSTSSSTSTDVDIDISGTKSTSRTTEVMATTSNGTVSKSTSRGQSAGLNMLPIALAACCLLIVLIIIIVLVLHKKKYFYKINHGKLVEEHSPASYYQIAFNGQGESVTFDQNGGIENPTYDFLNEPEDAEEPEKSGTPGKPGDGVAV